MHSAPHQLKPPIISEAEGKSKRYAGTLSSADFHLMNVTLTVATMLAVQLEADK
jgi:hypothetical protein